MCTSTDCPELPEVCDSTDCLYWPFICLFGQEGEHMHLCADIPVPAMSERGPERSLPVESGYPASCTGTAGWSVDC